MGPGAREEACLAASGAKAGLRALCQGERMVSTWSHFKEFRSCNYSESSVTRRAQVSANVPYFDGAFHPEQYLPPTDGLSSEVCEAVWRLVDAGQLVRCSGAPHDISLELDVLESNFLGRPDVQSAFQLMAPVRHLQCAYDC